MKKKLIIGVLVVAAVAVAVFLATRSASDTATPTAAPEGGKGYSNRYMTLNVAAGWKLSEASDAAGAVNITKGNWVLFISPAATQTSGVIGGNFEEFAGGAPGVETVMGGLPKPRNGYECGKAVVKNGVSIVEGTPVSRYDFTTVLTGALAGCRIPAEAPPAWFLSVVGNQAGFNDVSSVTTKKVVAAPDGFPKRQFAITMSYTAATVDDLPRQYTADLDAGLREMDSMVSTLVFK